MGCRQHSTIGSDCKKKSPSFDIDEGKEKKTIFGLILLNLESVPKRYVYQLRAPIRLVSMVPPLQPQSQYVGQEFDWICSRLPAIKSAGSSSHPQARLAIENVLGFRAIPAPDGVENILSML